MKLNLNPEYINYKTFFIASAYYQEIGEKTSKLFIINIINNRINIFPEFIGYHVIEITNKNYYLDKASIKLNGIYEILYDIYSCNISLDLIHSKHNETKS